MSVYAADAVLDMSPVGMGTHEGEEAIRRFVEAWRGSDGADYRYEQEEILVLGHGVRAGWPRLQMLVQALCAGRVDTSRETAARSLSVISRHICCHAAGAVEPSSGARYTDY